MKKLMILMVLTFATTIVISSCGDDAPKTDAKTSAKTEAPKKEEAPKAVQTASTVGDPVKGKELFTEKTCGACHSLDAKVVGPSIKDVATKYAEEGADMVKFLNGGAPAIVDTDPAQVAVMKNNIETILKDITDAEKADIAAYMLSTIK